MCRIWRIYIYIYIIHIKKNYRCCIGVAVPRWTDQDRCETKQGGTSSHNDRSSMMHICSTRSTRVSLQTRSFFFFFLNCFCVWIMTVSTFTSDIRYTSPCFFLSPRIVRGKKKRKSYKQIVRARQSALNNIPDSQDRYARAKLWLGLCKKRACCNMLPSEINAILIPFCFLYRSDFSIVRYKYNKIVTIARRKRSFVSEDVLECDKSSYFFLSIYCNRYNFLLFLEFCKRRRCFLSNIYICKNTNFCPKQLHVKSVTRTNSRMHAVCASVFS